jgi:hypothetical protein
MGDGGGCCGARVEDGEEDDCDEGGMRCGVGLGAGEGCGDDIVITPVQPASCRVQVSVALPERRQPAASTPVIQMQAALLCGRDASHVCS